MLKMKKQPNSQIRKVNKTKGKKGQKKSSDQ